MLYHLGGVREAADQVGHGPAVDKTIIGMAMWHKRISVSLDIFQCERGASTVFVDVDHEISSVVQNYFSVVEEIHLCTLRRY